MSVTCFASSLNFRLLSFSSSFFVSLRISTRKKETVAPSTLSSPCSVGTTSRGASAATYPPVTAAQCASGSSGTPGRFSGKGAFSLRRASYVSRTSPSTSPAGCALWWREVCYKCGSNDHWARECPKKDVGPSNLKKRNLGAYTKGAWTCSDPDDSRDEKCSLNLFQVDSLCDTAVSPVQDDDEKEAHAAFLVESEGFGVLDCGATTSLGSVEGAEALFSRVMNMILVFQRLIHLEVDHSTLEMVLHQRLLPCPDSQSEMMLLVISGSLCICSWISRNRLR